MGLSTQDKLKQRLPPFVVRNQLLDDLTKVIANRLDDIKSGHDTIRDMLTLDTALGRFLDEIVEDHGLFRSEDEADHLLRIRAMNIIPTFQEFGTRKGIEDYLAFLAKTRPYLEECWEGKWAWVIGFSAIGLDTWLGAALQFGMVVWNQTELTQSELATVVDGIIPMHVAYGINYIDPFDPDGQQWSEKAEMNDYPHIEASWGFDPGFPHTKSISDGKMTLDTTGDGDKAQFAQNGAGQHWFDYAEQLTGWTVQFRVRVDADNEGSHPGHGVWIDDGNKWFATYLTKDGFVDWGTVASGFEMDLSDDFHTVRIAGGGELGGNFKIWVDGTVKKTGALRPGGTKMIWFGDYSTNSGWNAGKTVWDYFRLYCGGAVEWGDAAGYFYETDDDFLSGTNVNFDVQHNALIPTDYTCSRESPGIDLGYFTYGSYTWLVDWLDYRKHDMDVDVKVYVAFSVDGSEPWSSWIECAPNQVLNSADVKRYIKYKVEVAIGSGESLSDYVFKQWTLKGLSASYSTYIPDWSSAHLPVERRYLPEKVPV